MTDDPEVFVHSVMFRIDDMVEITYLEKRHQTERAGASTSVVAEWDDVKDDIEDIQEALRDLIDRIWERIRHPEESKKSDED